ncbi:MAG: hypothetical protein U9Q81_11275, partial [Pseudomonadota bacterium]|nr:hypothetical protein [Pseudomonadota bacterium]
DTPGIIDNVEVSPFLVGVLARPPHDWMTLTRAIMGPDIDLEPTPGEFWSIRNFLKTALAEDADPIPGVTVEFLSGDDEELPFLSVADLKIRYPSVLDQWAELDPTIAEYVELLRRANTIASGEVPSRYPLPASIKQAFGALLSNIAKGEAQSAAEYLAGEIREQEDLLNRIAEVILAPGFRAVGARAEDATSPIAQQAMLMPDLPTSSAAESPVPTLPSRFEIITSYEDPLVKDERRHASFLFARVGDPLAWRLINFISDTGGPSVPLESGSRALRDW